MNVDKKSKEALKRYKRVRQTRSSSDSSSSSDSDSGSSSSYSSSASERRRRHKKLRQPTAHSSSSDDERRKREKREHCQKKLEAKRNHIKRKLKEAKLRKKAAAAAAALSGHSHRALSPSTQAKLKKLAERKHLRAVSKEKREREKHRASGRERERDHHVNSRSPGKITKVRIHQDVKRQKSPPRMHHQLMSREKIIIQTRNRERSTSAERERQRYEHKMRHEEMLRDRERREREVARDKERAEALARCQERQRERERLAREKLRRDEEEKYGKAPSRERERLLPRQSDREMAIKNRAFTSRERSLEHSRRDVDPYDHPYGRKHREENEYLREDGHERHPQMEREEMLREREYMALRRRELSPGEYASSGSGNNRIRTDLRGDMYNMQDELDRSYKRSYVDESHSHVVNHERWLNERDMRERSIHGQHEYRDMGPKQHFYRDERDVNEIIREREEQPFINRPPEWKHDWNAPSEWAEGIIPPPERGIGFIGGPKRGGLTPIGTKVLPNRELPVVNTEHDWDVEEGQIEIPNKPDINNRREGPMLRDWIEHSPREMTPQIRQEKFSTPVIGGKPHRPMWTPEWRVQDVAPIGSFPRPPLVHRFHSERGGRGGFRGGRGGGVEHGERLPNIHMHGFRPRAHGPLLNLPMGAAYHGSPHVQRFPLKRSLTYTNPNILKKQQAALAAATTAVAAAKAAAQSTANATTNPGILSQMGQTNVHMPFQQDEKPEMGEIISDENCKQDENTATSITKNSETVNEEKATGELSEISDSDDDILNKNEKKIKIEMEDTSSQECKLNENDNEIKKENENETETENKNEKEQQKQEEMDKDVKPNKDKTADEDILDFEEISDGELEEDIKTKGIADALGVDWASLVAETKRLPRKIITTAKEKWQAHRILLDVGVSMQMAGEEYAKKVLTDAQQKLNEEMINDLNVKKEESTNSDKEEKQEPDAQNSQTDIQQATTSKEVKLENKPLEIKVDNTEIVDNFHPLACVQVGERRVQMERKNLIANACGMNSRALSARQDLQLRRQLCGLPARECDFGRNIPPTSNELKAMALAAFQRTLEVQ